jgi:serine/threonine-protein kinase
VTEPSDRWRRVEDICHGALERSAGDRAAFLRAACVDDDDLRHEVETLLARESAAERFLETPVGAAAAQVMPPATAPLTGRGFGVFQVGALLGAGGMGAVYRARDTRLGRDVALKVLSPELAADPDRLARIEREARLLAALNHPHIAAIYGIEQVDGVGGLILELVEGPTLDDRIARGRLSLDETWHIAKQIAEALEAAHEKGIIHRDLKPANIKITPDGNVKVLDFGLATVRDVDGAPLDLATSPTMMRTTPGMILGTAPYMSPEQATGREADRTADVWAFGCVLYEMLTGCRAFDGDGVGEILAAILKADPDWRRLPADTPEGIRRLLRRSLQKDQKLRFRDIRDARLEIEDLARAETAEIWPGPERAQKPGADARKWRFAAVLATVVLSGAVAASAAWLAMRSAPPRMTRLMIAPSGTAAFNGSINGRGIAISPDGSQVIYVGNNGTQLFARPLDRLEPVALTAPGALRGFCLSPDGLSVAFVEEYTLKKVALAGGPTVTLGGFGGGNLAGITWGANGTIVFATDASSTGLLQVPEAGGQPSVLTRPDSGRGEVDHSWPESLPGGRAVLYTVINQGGINNAQVAVLDLQTGVQKMLVRGGSHARYVPSGHLVYAASGTLRAVRFDLNRLEAVGASVPVVAQLRTSAEGSADFDVASNGTLVYVFGPLQVSARALVWVDRQGQEESIKAPARAFQYPRLSPDGTRVALDIRDQENDIWIWEFARETLTRFTHDPALDRFPAWTPDSRRLLFASDRIGAPNVFWQAADGSGAPEQLSNQATGEQMPMSVTPDGAQLLVRSGIPQGFDLTLLMLSGDHHVEALLHTPSSEQNGEISPDGRWLAYQSNESGQPEVYVRPFQGVDGGRWLVSSGGGLQPLWAPGGGELFYLSPRGALMSVRVERAPTWTAAAPTKLFDGPYRFGGGAEAFGRAYDVSRDARRFLMIKDVKEPAPTAAPLSLIVVQNWTEELKARVPVK